MTNETKKHWATETRERNESLTAENDDLKAKLAEMEQQVAVKVEEYTETEGTFAAIVKEDIVQEIKEIAGDNLSEVAVGVSNEELKQQLVEANEESVRIEAAMAHGRYRREPRTESEELREERIPLGGQRLRLELRGYDEQLEGYVPRWINDDGDRIIRALEGGYEPVFQNGRGKVADTDMGSWVCKTVGTARDNSPQRAYALKIREDLYEEDQAAKRRTIEDIEREIKGGDAPGSDQMNPHDKAHTYAKNVQIGR